MSEDDENAEYDVGSEEVFPLNPDSADLCAIARTKSPKSSQGENMPPGGIIVITGAVSTFQKVLFLPSISTSITL